MSTAKKSAYHLTVAEYITLQLDACDRTQFDIAKEVGFEKPNMITMIKQGRTKLPLAKVGLMARALGVDPGHLFKITMQEYYPETWDALEATLGGFVATTNEVKVIEQLRKAGLGTKELTGDQTRDLAKHLRMMLPKDD